MRRRIEEYPFLYLSLVIGLIISAATWIAGLDELSSIILGLSLTTLGITLELLSQIRQYQEQTSNLFDLHKGLGQDELLRARVTNIIKAYYLASGMGIPLFTQRAKDIIERCTRDIEDLARGNYHGSAEHDKQENLDVVKLTQQTLKATSYVDAGWWTDESGQRYLEENKRLIDNGRQITRVFIADQVDSETKNVLKKQLNLGVQLWIARARDVPVHLREDYFISDDKILSLSEINREGETKQILTSIDKWLVERYVGYFDNLLLRARRINTEQEIENL